MGDGVDSSMDDVDNMDNIDNIDGMTGGTPVFEHFGQVLRYLRKYYYAEHVLRMPPGASAFRLTALSLIECLTKHGYSLSSGAFSALEAGTSLPRDPGKFLDTLSRCLPMPARDPLWETLVWRLAYDILLRDLGKPWVDELLPPPVRAGQPPAAANGDAPRDEDGHEG
jgi:hypothetical protein